MAELDNLIELIRTTNEVYFITAPERVRAAFILVDDIVELALKTYLHDYALEQQRLRQEDLENNQPILLRTPQHQKQLNDFFGESIDLAGLCSGLGVNGSKAQSDLHKRISRFQNLHHWSVYEPSNRISMDNVIQEIKDLNPSEHTLNELLDGAFDRHKIRNIMYHDHQQSGLGVLDVQCLRAFCDLFVLLCSLFPQFTDLLQLPKNSTVKAQVGVLQLKLQACEGRQEVSKPYNDALEQLKAHHNYELNPRSIEHSILHTVSDRFFNAVQENFKDQIAELEVRIEKLKEMIADPKRRRVSHPPELADKKQLLVILQRQFNQFTRLMGS